MTKYKVKHKSTFDGIEVQEKMAVFIHTTHLPGRFCRVICERNLGTFSLTIHREISPRFSPFAKDVYNWEHYTLCEFVKEIYRIYPGTVDLLPIFFFLLPAVNDEFYYSAHKSYWLHTSYPFKVKTKTK